MLTPDTPIPGIVCSETSGKKLWQHTGCLHVPITLHSVLICPLEQHPRAKNQHITNRYDFSPIGLRYAFKQHKYTCVSLTAYQSSIYLKLQNIKFPIFPCWTKQSVLKMSTGTEAGQTWIQILATLRY